MPLTTFLDGRAYTQTRGLLFLALSDAGQIVTEVATTDTGGGATRAWTAGTVNIPCRIDALAGGEQLVAQRVSDRSTHVIMVAANTVPTPVDRFAITGRGTFEITAVRDRTREWVQELEAVQI